MVKSTLRSAVLLLALGSCVNTADGAGALTINFEPGAMSCPSSFKIAFNFEEAEAGKLIAGTCAKVSVVTTKPGKPEWGTQERWATFACGSGSDAQMTLFTDEACASEIGAVQRDVNCEACPGGDTNQCMLDGIYCPCPDGLSPGDANGGTCSSKGVNPHYYIQSPNFAISNAPSFFEGVCVLTGAGPAGMVAIHADTLANLPAELPACSVKATQAPTAVPAPGSCRTGMDCAAGWPEKGCSNGECTCNGKPCDPEVYTCHITNMYPGGTCAECTTDQDCADKHGKGAKCFMEEGTSDYLQCMPPPDPVDNSVCAGHPFVALVAEQTDRDDGFKCWETCAPGAEANGTKAILIQAGSMNTCHSYNDPDKGTQYMQYKCGDGGGVSGGKFTRGDCGTDMEEIEMKPRFPMTGYCSKGGADMYYHMADSCEVTEVNGMPVFRAVIRFFEDGQCKTPITGCVPNPEVDKAPKKTEEAPVDFATQSFAAPVAGAATMGLALALAA